MRDLQPAAILTSILLLGGCNQPPVAEECKAQLLENLKSPSSLNVISAKSFDTTITFEQAKKEYLLPKDILSKGNAEKLTFRHDSIEYDADNSYGASLRDTEYCIFLRTPSGVVSVEYNHDNLVEEALEGTDALADDGLPTNEREAPPGE